MRKADHVTDRPERRHLVEGNDSTANIGGHPIHPMLVLFPAAFLVGALVTDIVYAFNGATFWADASIWLVGAGLVMGAVAGIAGATDFFTLHRPRQLTIGWVHAIGNVGVVILSLANLLIRVDDPATAILPWGLVLSIIVSATLLVTGWAGGELAYRHGIGVVGEGSPMGTGLDEEAREHERARARPRPRPPASRVAGVRGAA
jgi:uncharacterized membrane protein